MKYILMMNAPKGGWEGLMSWPKETQQAHIQFMMGFTKKLADAGELVSAEGLTPPNEAKVVKAGKNGTPVIDGVFAETKEFLAGWWIVEVPSADRAYQIAAEASAAPGPKGPLNMPIEVRQVASGPPPEML
jgi:hypothetical protein